MQTIDPTPIEISRFIGNMHDTRMWETITNRKMALPFCDHCNAAVYPPFGSCAGCLRAELPWRTLSGRGKIVSWTRFHRSYLPAYPAPHVVIAVELEEGAIMISNLVGPSPEDDLWIGQHVVMRYLDRHGTVLPVFEIVSAAS